MADARFWSSSRVEPRRSYRWWGLIDLTGPTAGEFGPPVFNVKSFTKPKINLDSEKVINNFTSQTRIITKNYTWDNCTIVFHDMETGYNASDKVYGWLTSMGYQPVQNAKSLSKFFTNIQNNTFNLKLAHLDSKGRVTESWNFIEPQPVSIDFGGDLSYDTDESLTVSMEITYVAAEYQKKF